LLTLVADGPKTGIVVVARDEGPGIPDVALAMQDGYSTSGSLGLGLPGAGRLMDELEIDSRPGNGTTVTMRKWVHRSAVRIGR
jgi:serine/threonine-protein kinase RsbT